MVLMHEPYFFSLPLRHQPAPQVVTRRHITGRQVLFIVFVNVQHRLSGFRLLYPVAVTVIDTC
jgi:hypothetical protein